jgi:hypothetical protein
MFCFCLSDEALTSVVLGVKEGEKMEGLQAAVTGAAASLIAQVVTTPVRATLYMQN